MKYNFDKPTNRRLSSSVKWDTNLQVDYPLWVADMDFEVAPAIVQAMQQQLDHRIFGYAQPLDSYFDSIIRWHQRRHGMTYQREWMIVVPGIVPAISAILRAMTKPGDAVLLLSPNYNAFYSSIRNLECRTEECQLVPEGDSFRIDFDDLERRASKEDVRVMLLCTPHNPCGRIWTREELQQVGDICLKHNVFIVADEIHCEIIMPGQQFTAFATLGDLYMQHACICTSASKTFNIAGLHNAQIICPNAQLRQRIDRAVNIHEICDVGPFGLVATEAAYNESEEWLTEMCSYVWGNYNTMRDFIEKEIPQLRVTALQATYLMWLDIRALGMTSDTFCKRLQQEKKVWLAEGPKYGQGGEGFVRVNMAAPRQHLMEAMHLLKDFIAESR